MFVTCVKYTLYTVSPQLVHKKGPFDARSALAYALHNLSCRLMTTTKELWENTLVELELSISKPNFSTWFKDTHVVKIEDGVAYVGVPSQFARDWLSTKFHKDILRSLRGFADSIRNVEYIISRSPKKAVEEVHARGSAELPL